MDETDLATSDVDLDLDESEFAALMLAVDEEDSKAGRRKRPPAPFDPPAVGEPVPEGWFLADGSRPEVTVSKVEGRKVYAVYSGACGRCSGRGGSEHWPGFTCFGCSGSGDKTRQVRLYDAAGIEAIAAGKERKRASVAERHETARRERVERSLVDATAFRATNADFLRKASEARVAEQDVTCADILSKIDLYGGLTEGQVAYVTRVVERLRQRESDRANSRWLGAVGARIEARGTVQRSFDTRFTQYNRTTVTTNYVLADPNGNVFLFRGADDLVAKKGDELRVKGTVKGHDEYDGVRNTRLLRVKVLEHTRIADLKRIVEASSREGDVIDEATEGPRP